jgi:hypothetical protein
MQWKELMQKRMPISNAMFFLLVMFTMAIGVCAVTIYATSVIYDPAKSELPASNVQDAIDKLDENLDTIQLTPGPAGETGVIGPSGPIGPKGSSGPTGIWEVTLIASASGSDSAGISTTSSTSYTPLTSIPIFIPENTTKLFGKIRQRMSYNAGSGYGRFRIGSIPSEEAITQSLNPADTPELTIVNHPTGWQSLVIEGRVGSGGIYQIISYTIYATTE